jgi:hypothetical protein
MAVPVEHERKPRPSWWILLPLEQAAVFGLMSLAVPGAWAACLLSEHQLLFGAAVLLAWLTVIGGLGVWAHRRRYVRRWITGLLVATLFISCIVLLITAART